MLTPKGGLVALGLALLWLLPPPVNARRADDPDKVVCKSQALVGTRFHTRICHTRRDWEKLAEEHKRMAREMIDKPIIQIGR